MSELKTLKDLQKEFEHCYDEDSIVPASMLKEEVIEWIKSLMDDRVNRILCGKRMLSLDGSEDSIIILKHIFNITNEDLK